MAEEITTKDRRTHPRRSVIWMGTLKVGDFSFSCRVLDLSLAGARIKLALPLKRNAAVTLSITRCGDLPAEISWHKDDRLGLNFTIPAAEVRRLLGPSAVSSLGLDVSQHNEQN
ncbi:MULTISPECIES: PilZ domain-containing protein [Iodidimonas]|jgi:hypothetical protein|uniref:PilZ domain-containing protein n=1 Tax=Iodidimonas nitroreducens TaxID=1236968 RepID=A0A5A7NCB5_9PROT|nr:MULTISPECIES: PilZ domain-containing protein [Iodidimonas]GAK34250.1 pilZ domain protein [alpha proteobacterium Q-1]GER04699.1 hypothetical protein JCM17846_23810 [Iodidimonas nitroreducens]